MDDDKVTITHPKYDAAEPQREVYRDVCQGTEKMRAAGKTYMPQFPAEHPEDWNYRKNTATLLNVTLKTRDTLCGLVFQKDLTLNDDVPESIAGTETQAGLIENIDNKGNHLNVFARDLFEASFDGCAGILVDAPANIAQSLEEEQRLGIRPYWVTYKACDITNWDYQVNPISKKLELSLVVLRECVTAQSGQFKRTEKTQYRVLMLTNPTATVGRRPVWQLWTEKAEKGADGKTEYEMTEAGAFEKQVNIPFAIVGDLSDKPPLIDLAYKNIEHWQTYSDYKSIIHKTCVPMLWTAGLDGDAPKSIGGSSWWKLTENGQMGFAEPTGGSIEKTRTCLEDIKADMSWLGLQMLMPKPKGGGKNTATEVVSDQIQDTSELKVKATQLKDAIELALGFTALYLGEKEGGSIELGATWAEMVLSPQELNALSGLVDLGQMSKKSLVWRLSKAGLLPPEVTVEDELKEIESDQQDAMKMEPVINATKQPNEKGIGSPNPAGDQGRQSVGSPGQ